MKNREWAYATLKSVSIEEALREDVKTVCDFLAKETGYSADTFRPFTPKKNKELSPAIIKAVECAKMKREFQKLSEMVFELIEDKACSVSDMWSVRVSEEKLNEIEDFLNREEK